MGTRARRTLRLGSRALTLGDRTVVMGVLNCTPDSFYDGGRYSRPEQALARYDDLVAAGADWVDVGGESTRPGAAPVDAGEEWRRVAPVVEHARRAGHPVVLSIDTTKYDVAARALDAGAGILNDISALDGDVRLADLAARFGAGLILMHMLGTPRTMQQDPTYDDVLSTIQGKLAAAQAAALGRGVDREQIIVDPGIGFGKTVTHNLEILRRLDELAALERPILVGCSRKSFIGALSDQDPERRLEGTVAAHTAAVLAGAHIVRVHDVGAHVRALRVVDALLSVPGA